MLSYLHSFHLHFLFMILVLFLSPEAVLHVLSQYVTTAHCTNMNFNKISCDDIFLVHTGRNSSYSFCPWIVSSFEWFPQQNFSLLSKKLKFAATVWISFNFQIQKTIVSVETIRGNTVGRQISWTRDPQAYRPTHYPTCILPTWSGFYTQYTWWLDDEYFTS